MLAREVRNREVGAHNAAGELRFGVLQSFATLRFSPILANATLSLKLYFATDTTDTDIQNLMHKISTQDRTHAQNRNSKACMG